MDLHGAKVLLSEQDIQTRTKALTDSINQDYSGQELLVVGILKGAFVFMADLIRGINIPLKIDFMAVSSYGLSTESSGEVRIMKDLEQSVEGKNILIVEDIIDSGLTLKYITEILKKRNPQSIRICTFLDKPSRRKVQIIPDYNGFSIPDHFVVGYGLDYAEKYRNLPCVCILDPATLVKE
ncbi:MAG: hypoxanthine phosphoribosyltransferase [Chitinophagales bacterium]